MKKLFFFGILSICTIVSSSITVQADGLTALIRSAMATYSINPHDSTWAKRGYLQYPFSAPSQKLPEHYKGHSAKQIYAGLSHMGSTSKGKFETSSQYQLRVRQLSAKSLFGSVHKTSPLAFSISATGVKYDADTQLMELQPRISNFTIEWDPKFIDSYDAQNTFGAKVTVTEQSHAEYGIDITNPDGFKNLKYQAKIPLKLAPSFERSLKLLFVGYIAEQSPTGRDVQSAGPATYSSPFSFITLRYYVKLRLKYVLLYNYETGEILRKFNPVTSNKPTPKSLSNSTIPSRRYYAPDDVSRDK